MSRILRKKVSFLVCVCGFFFFFLVLREVYKVSICHYSHYRAIEFVPHFQALPKKKGEKQTLPKKKKLVSNYERSLLMPIFANGKNERFGERANRVGRVMR